MVTEKTLELNITAELLDYFRLFDPTCFFKGLTLWQEGVLGYDESLVQGGTVSELLFFQFKAQRRGIPYFWINNNRNRDQHNLLLNIALVPRSVFYVFPLFNTDQDVADSSPNLLQETYFADILDIGPLTPRWHRAEIDPLTLRATIQSEPKKVKLIPGKRMVEILKEKEFRKSQDQKIFDPVLESRPMPHKEVEATLRRCFWDEEFRKRNELRSKQIKTWGLVK